jgi:hypothetical protein
MTLEVCADLSRSTAAPPVLLLVRSASHGGARHERRSSIWMRKRATTDSSSEPPIALPAARPADRVGSDGLPGVIAAYFFFGAHSKDGVLWGGCLQTPAYTCSSPEAASENDSHQ